MHYGLVVVAVTAVAAQAQVDWTDWQSATSTQVNGVAGSISVTYTGGWQFTQLNGGTDYWNPASTYSSAQVPNAPGDSDIIALNNVGGTLSFSSPVTNPVMAIVSLGQGGIGTRWNFDAPFQILTNGPGNFGNGAFSLPGGNVLQGNEAHGLIQFQGTFTSISWSINDGESWAGFTIGVPAPGSAAVGVLALATLRRRR